MQTVQNTFRQTKNQFASLAKYFLVHQIPFYKPCKAHLVDQIPFYKPCKILFGGPDSISQVVQTPFGGPNSILKALQTPCGSTRYHFARFWKANSLINGSLLPFLGNSTYLCNV